MEKNGEVSNWITPRREACRRMMASWDGKHIVTDKHII